MSITPPDVSNAIFTLQSAVTFATPLQGAPAATLVPVVNAAIALQQTIALYITATDDLVGVGGSLASGTAPLDAINYLTNQIGDVLTDSNLQTLQAYANRVAINLNALL